MSATREVVFVGEDVGGVGGMERVSEEIVRGLLRAGLRVTLVSRTCGMGPLPGLTFVRVRTPSRPATVAYPAFILAASWLVARRRGDALVHSTGALLANHADVSTVHYCHRAAAHAGVGSVASRETLLYRLNSAVARWQIRRTEGWAYRPSRTQALCPVSEGVGRELRRFFPHMTRRVHAVPNGVDAERFRPSAPARTRLREGLGLTDATPLALFTGSDWARKGLRYAIEALSHASDWHLAVAGTGDRSAALAQAAAVGATDRLHLLGRRTDMPDVYPAADAFVFPTAYEAFPLAALEAAASGLPLLISRVNGVEDLLRESENGWFVARDGADIGRRLTALHADPAAAARMRAAARRAAEPYSWQAMVDRYLAIYEATEA